MTTAVSQIPAADPAEASERFQARLRFETDCWDVHESMGSSARDFVLVDARSAAAYEQGHVPGAINIPHRTMTKGRMSEYPADTLFVTYCSGPHCNGSTRAAIAIAALGFRVKEMIGGVTGWLDEGLPLEAGVTEAPIKVACGC